MKKTFKIFLIAFISILLVSMLAVCAFATGVEEEQIPAFSVTNAAGEVTNYYNGDELETVVPTLVSGDKITLLSDITFSLNNAVIMYFPSGSAAAEGEEPTAGYKEFYFDFNGYSIKSTKKTSPLFNCGNYSNLYIYSSRPGARYFGKDVVEYSKTYYGQPFATCSGANSNLHIGEFGEYSGDNLYVYACCVVDATLGTVNVKGGQYFRNVGDYSGFFIMRGNGTRGKITMNISDAVVMGVDSELGFNVGAGSGSGEMIFNNCIIIGKQNGKLLNNISYGYKIVFNDCKFFNTGFEANGTATSKDDPTFVPDPDTPADEVEIPKVKTWGECILSENCVFDVIPVFYDYVVFPENYAIVKADRDFDGVLSYNVFGTDLTNISYEVVDYPTHKDGNYILTTTDNTAEVIWSYGLKSVTEIWALGEVPVNPFLDLKDNETVKYVIEGHGPLTGDCFLSVEEKRNFDVYVNLTVYSSLNVNFYIPINVFENITSVSATGASAINVKDLPKVTVNGVECYQITVSGLKLSNCVKSYSVSIDTVDGNGNECSLSVSIALTDYAKQILQGDFTSDEKEFISGTLNRIKKAYENLDLTVPPALTELIGSSATSALPVSNKNKLV